MKNRSPYKTISRTHGDTSHCIISKVLRYFHNQNTAVFGVYFNCFILMNFEQDEEEALNLLIPKYITSLIYGGMVEAVASENGATLLEVMTITAFLLLSPGFK